VVLFFPPHSVFIYIYVCVCVFMQLFTLLVDNYCKAVGSLAELSRWAAEIYSTFLVSQAVNIAIIICQTLFFVVYMYVHVLQCFAAVGWVAGRTSGL